MASQVSSSLWDATQAEDSQSSASLSHSQSWDASHSGPRRAKRQKPNLYTKADLQQRVLCSDAELDAALDALNCIITSHGHVMLPAPDAVTACLDSLLTIAAGGWDLERIAEPQCLAEMQDFHDPALISHVLRSYCRPGPPPAPDSTPVWALDIPKVCCFCVRQLFEAAASWREADFMAQWSAIVPDGVAPALDMLWGDAVLEAQGALVRPGGPAAGPPTALRGAIRAPREVGEGGHCAVPGRPHGAGADAGELAGDQRAGAPPGVMVYNPM